MIEVWTDSEYGPGTWEAVEGKNIRVIGMGSEIQNRLAEGDTSLGANRGYIAIPY